MPAAQIVLVTGASSGFGRLTALSLARAGHTVLAGMRQIADRNAASAAAAAAMDTLAESYAAELVRFGIDTSIVVPGAFTSGTNHFAHAGHPADAAHEGDYDERYDELRSGLGDRLAKLSPPDSDVQTVADEIVRVVGLPAGQRPFRTHIDPTRDGSEVVSAVADRIRAEFYHRAGIADLLPAHASL